MALVLYQEPTYEEVYSAPIGAMMPYSNEMVSYAPASNALVPYSSPVTSYGGGQLVAYNAPSAALGPANGALVVASPAPVRASVPSQLYQPGDAIVPGGPIAPKTLKKRQEAIRKATPVPIGHNRTTIPTTTRMLRPYVDEAYLACFLSANVTSLGQPGELLEVVSGSGVATAITVGHGGADSPNITYRQFFDPTRAFIVFRGGNEIQFPLKEPDLTPVAGGRIAVNVHSGYYRALIPHMNNILRQINANPRPRVVITGFGNGGALASVMYLAMKAAGGHTASLGLYTFGAPLVSAPVSSMTMSDPFKDEAWHYVLEGDPVPSILGQRDTGTVDTLLGPGNMMHTAGYNSQRLKAFCPFGSYFYMQRSGCLVEPRDLRDAQGMLDLHRRPFIRPQNHNARFYMDALRSAVQGA